MNKDKIYTTTDYSKFVLIKGNRVVEEQERRVKGLSESIKLRGLKNPILVIEDDKTGKLIVVDGQGRFSACKKINVPVRYTFDPEEYQSRRHLLDSIRSINKDQKNWSPTDVGNSYSVTEYGDSYQRYMQLVNMGVSHSFVLKACEEFSKDGECEVGSKAFGRGDLVISDEVFEKVKMQISMLQNSKIDKKIWNRQYFIRALMKLRRMENFDVYKFIENFEKFPYEWKNCYQVNDNIKSILHVHNYKNRKKAKYYFE